MSLDIEIFCFPRFLLLILLFLRFIWRGYRLLSQGFLALHLVLHRSLPCRLIDELVLKLLELPLLRNRRALWARFVLFWRVLNQDVCLVIAIAERVLVAEFGWAAFRFLATPQQFLSIKAVVSRHH